MTFLVFLAGLLLSAAAAYYSIVGLVALFPGAMWAIIAMGVTLEFGKLVAVSWLYRNWRIAPRFLKAYLMVAVLLLMLITSMGIFGFLSRAHLEHSITAGADVTYQIESIEQRIDSKRQSLAFVDKQLSALDATYNRYVELGSLTKGLEQRGVIEKERATLMKQRDAVDADLLQLMEQRNRIDVTKKQQEVEVGPLKYIAELVYGDTAEKHFDQAVRMVIIMLIVVFDPLAVMLLIAGNVSLLASVPAPQEVKSFVPTPKRKYNTRRKKDAYVIKESDDFGIKPVDWQPSVLRTKE